MSHYNSDREADALRTRVALAVACKKSGRQLERLRADLPGEVPERFRGHLDDLDCWLRLNSTASERR